MTQGNIPTGEHHFNWDVKPASTNDENLAKIRAAQGKPAAAIPVSTNDENLRKIYEAAAKASAAR